MSQTRPPLGQFLLLAAGLGVASGFFEVGLRADARLGMGLSEQLSWLGISALLSTGYLGLAGLVAWGIGRRSHGLLIGALIFLHAAIIYRFDFVVNHFLRDPVVWGGGLVIGLACLGLGLLVDRIVREHLRRVYWALLSLA